jgi:hypothetical protein
VAGLSPYSLTTPMARFSPGGSLLHPHHPGEVNFHTIHTDVDQCLELRH